MKTTGIIEETGRRIESILADREKELIALDEQISVDAEAIAAANAAMEKATGAGNLKEYQQAKADRANALDAKEMHEARRDALRNKPLISSADYEKTV